MKKAIVILLLGAFAFLVSANAWLQPLLGHRAKQVMDFRLEHETRFTTFSKQELHNAKWKGAREFVLNGEWYDVHHVLEYNNDTICYCVHDRLETGISRQEDAMTRILLDLDHHPQGKLIRSLSNWLHALYFHAAEASSCPPAFLAGMRCTAGRAFQLPVGNTDITDPPPEA